MGPQGLGAGAVRRYPPCVLEIRVLGRLAVEHAGAPASTEADPSGPSGPAERIVALPASRRARDLLAYLATHPGRHPRSGLAGRFWPDVPEASARSSLRGALAELRRSLGPVGTALSATREEVGLDRTQVRVDLEEFRRLTADQRWHEALALDRGRLLADVEHDWADWLRAEHLRELTAALGAAADAYAAEGRTAEAVALARRRARLEPLSEPAAARLVELLVASGDRPAAVEVGRALVDRLQRELGVRPSAATTRLLAGLRTPDLEADPADAPVVSGPTAPALHELAAPRLLGRTAELARLRDLRRGPRLRAAVLRGEAGIGKTSLAVAAATEAAAEGCTVLYGRCDEEGIVPYCAWIEALGRAVDDLDAEVGRGLVDEGGEHLLRWFPQLRHLVPAHERPSLASAEAPDGERWRLFEAITRLLVRLSQQRPVVLVLDDLHWADRSTLLLLRHVVRTTQDAAVTVVATTRSTDAGPDAPVHAVLAQLRRDGLVTEVEVPGLTEDQVGELVGLHTDRPDRAALTSALFAETEGNPFFVGEILRNLPTGPAAAAPRADAGFAVPAGVRDLLQRRLGRLDAAARELMAVAAVVGRDFDLDTVVAVSGQPEQVALAALETAVAADLVDEVGVGRYTFTHALVRATLDDDLSRTRRARLHAKVGVALERRLAGGVGPLPSAAELAHHFLAASDPVYADVAVGYARQAYVEAMSRLAYNEAAASTRRTIEALRAWGRDDRSTTAPPVVGALLLELGEALSRAGDTAAARQAFAEAADAARIHHQPAWLATAALGWVGPSWQTFGTVEDDTVALLEEALAAIGGEHPGLRVRLTARLAIALYFAGRPAHLQELTWSALTEARELDDDAVLAAALEGRLWAQWRPDRVGQRIAVADELVAVAERSGLAEAALTGRRWRVFALMEAGNLVSAWREADRHAAGAHRLRLPYEQMYVAVFAFTRAVLEGRLDDAEQAATQVRAFGEVQGGADAVQFGGVHALTFAYLRGDLGALADAVAAFADGYPAVPGWRGALAVTLLAAGRPDEARAALDRVWPPQESLPFDAVWLAAMGFLSLAVVLLGDADRARHLRALLRPYAGRPVVLGAGGAVWGTADVYLALLAGVLGDAPAAERHQARAAEDLARMGSDPTPMLAALGALVGVAEAAR